MKKEEKLEKYPKTDLFEVVDTIGVPHPYVITQSHVSFAADHCGGRLGEDAVLEAERQKKARCGMKDCNLDYQEHERALLIGCKEDNKDKLKEYLLSIKEMAEKDGFAGFAFKKEF